MLFPSYLVFYTPDTKSVPTAIKSTAASKDEAREFMAIFPDLVRSITDSIGHRDGPELAKWCAKVLQYNVPGGKKNRGLALVLTYKLLKSKLTKDEIFLAQVMGWCIEILQAKMLVADDIMDNSLTRRGRPCWYLTHNLGVKALNDALLLGGSLFYVLKKYFKNEPYYVDILDLFHDVMMKTFLGQHLDTHTALETSVDLNKFTMARYNLICKYKTSYYSFVLPIQSAMYMAGITDIELHRQAKTILLEMGHFFQVQDDYLDCFGDPEVMGKQGTDIQDGKCTWLAVVALQRVNKEQRKIMEDCYGQSGSDEVAKIKRLYEEIGIPATYGIYEEETFNIISTHIQQISQGLPHELFLTLMNKIYRRQS
ncbi:hypothetical protein RUM43_014568 [Polyplax serrata]|uniref:Farnesyl pyrophosphate synthase n=1 Tax=Polyplax serrata TaxID=468196 RepID=A0AAN8RXU1_POLSC